MWELAVSVVAIAIQGWGIWLAIQALLNSRTPQAAIAWVLGLLILPVVAIPLFLFFGQSRFSGYNYAGDGRVGPLDKAHGDAQAALLPFEADLGEKYSDSAQLAERILKIPVTGGNRVRLLIDGAETFDAIGQAIDEAKQFVVFQFFIIRDDGLGRAMQSRLLAARARGVRVLVLVDQVGSHKLPQSYRDRLRSAGVEFAAFETNREQGQRFRLNFRNHRKLVLVDGIRAYLGGQNVADEYLGKVERFGPWRDTFVEVVGPGARALQVPFLEDWNFATGEVPELGWKVEVGAGVASVCTIPGGPARTWNIIPATYLEVIRSARERIWFASPYFVPDSALRSAIAHAALRGVDVRILLPQNPDHLLPWLSSFTYYPAMSAAGVRIFRYLPGFMHQKVMLVDDDLAFVGSTNLDYRSFFLNFELSVAVADREFAGRVEEMLEADFLRAREEDLAAFERSGILFRLKCKAAALLSPEQ